MRRLWAAIVHEYRSQIRSLRFRVIALLYLAINAAPLVMLRSTITKVDYPVLFCEGTYAAYTQVVMSVTSLLAAFLISSEALSREREDESLIVLGIAPVTNASYSLLRLAGVLSVLVPLSILALLLNMGITISAGISRLDLWLFLVPWLVKVLPLIVTSTMAGIGLGTFTGGVVSSALTGLFLLIFGGSLVGYILGHAGKTLPGADFTLHALFNTGPLIAQTLAEDEEIYGYATAISDAPIDWRVYCADILVHILPWLGCGIFLFSLTVPYLRRTRPDIATLKVSQSHPLRSYVKTLNRMRQHFSPESGLAVTDKLVLLAGFLCLVAGPAYLLSVDSQFTALAFDRLKVERSGEPLPTERTLAPEVYRISGEVKPDHSAHFETTLTVSNTGQRPLTGAAFVLNQFYNIRSIRMNGAPCSYKRAFDRLSVVFPAPLLFRQSAEIRFEYDGCPMTVDFPLRQEHEDGTPISFVGSMFPVESHREPVSFARTELERDLTARRIFLADSDLIPVVRYTTWKMQTNGFIKDEEYHVPFRYTLDVRGPAGMLLAESSGSVSEGADHPRLQAQQQTPVWRVALLGAPVEKVHLPLNVATMAVLPPHAATAAKTLEGFGGAINTADGILSPNENPFHKMVILDWPMRMRLSVYPSGDELQGFWSLVQAEGNVCLLSETVFHEKEFHTELMAVPMLQNYFLSQRLLNPAQFKFFRNWFLYYFLRRIHPERTWTCVLSSSDDQKNFSDDRLLDGPKRFQDSKARYILMSLINRVGGNALLEGMRKFLLKKDAGPGTAKEMFDDIGAAAKDDLSDFYGDYIAGKDLPILEFGKTDVEKIAEGWKIKATVKNEGTGHARFPFEIQTEAGSVERSGEIGPKQEITVEAVVKDRPRLLLLDPAEKAFRYQPKASKMRVELQVE